MTPFTSYASVGYYNDDFINAMGWSLQDMKNGIDRLVKSGFTGIDFDLSVPYDSQGNLLTLKYQRLASLLTYCQEKGIQTSVHLYSVLDYVNSGYIGSYGYEMPQQSLPSFFNSMKKFFTQYGPIFQSTGVDVISVGGSNLGIMGSANHDYWAGAIGALRSTFHGLLTYQADSIKKGLDHTTLNDVGIWDLLDAASIWLKPYVSDVPVSSYLDALQGYYFDKNHQSIMQELTSFVQAKHLPLLLQYNAMSLNNALDGGWDPTPTQVVAGSAATNFAQQLLAYRAVFDFVANHLGPSLASDLLAVQIANFSLAPDNSPLGVFSMENFPEPATTELVRFLKDSSSYSPSRVVQGGPGNDNIYLSSGSNVAQLNGGFDTVMGSPANDTIIFAPVVNFAELTGDISAWLDSQSNDFTIQVKENGVLVGSLKLPTGQISPQQVNTWMNFPDLHFKLPTNVVPGSLELSLSTSTGKGFVSATNFKLYWLGDKPIALAAATQLGNNTSSLASANPNWILAGGSKQADLSSLGLSFNNTGTTQVTGAAGTDTVVFTGAYSDYTITKTIVPGKLNIADKRPEGNGPSVLQEIERLQFTDGTLALDIAPGQNAGEVYRLYQAAFARTPDMPGVKYHLNDMESNGLPLWQIASNFLASPEFSSKYGSNPSDTQYINALYKNVLNRTPAESEVAWYQNQFTTKAMDHQAALIGFSESPENVALVGSAIANGIWLG